MAKMILTKRRLPQNPNIEVLVPNYKEPILAVNHGGAGWYGLMAQHIDGSGRLMCHECGEFWDYLSSHITQKHKLALRQYRAKYGLLRKTSLISESLLLKRRVAFIRDGRSQKGIEALRKMRYIPNGKTGERPIEILNRHDSCSAQLLRILIEAASLFGVDVTQRQINIYRPGFAGLLCLRFGSFNKAKQLAKLVLNSNGFKRIHTRQLILEDMCNFFNIYHRWPTLKDYSDHKMICGRSPLRDNGGIEILRQEAMQLKQEQDARVELGKKVSQIAEDIEFGNAGHARR